MTSVVERSTPAGMPGGRDREDARTSRWSRWAASWRVALRMARRDLRRHKGRGTLVFLMVAIPVGLIAGAATLGATEQTDASDLVTARMGSGQAFVQGPAAGTPIQGPDPNQGLAEMSDPPTPIPGFRPDGSAADKALAVGELVGGQAVAVGETETRLVKGDRRIRVTGLVIDPRIADVGRKARLTGGHWGHGPTEIVVTPAGVAKGLPTSGAVTLSAAGTESTVSVVGTALALSEGGGQPEYVVPAALQGAPASSGYAPTSWIITGRDAVSWEEVKKLNTYGLTVVSRSVLANPPPTSELPPELRQQQSFTQDTGQMIAVIGGVMLFIITTLLVGPAFAVSASRQRRTLALAATNGAEVRQLRRTVLAQALLLGVISAVGGVLLGMAGVRAGLWWWVRTHPSTHYAALPLDIPWEALAILLPCAVLSALVAALLPSMRLGRLDIIGVMRGQSVSPKLNKVLPIVGLALAAVGAFVVLGVARMPPGMVGGDFRIAIGAIGLVLGTLLVIPALLVLSGRLAAHLPVATRIAVRDAARHRSRSSPTVAAILAGATALTAFSIGLASDTKQQMVGYAPQTLRGEGVIYTGDAEVRLAVDAALRDVGADLVKTPYEVVRGPVDPMMAPSPGSQAEPVPFVAALLPGCTLEDSIVSSGPDTTQCVALGTQAYENGFIGVLPAAEIARRLGLTGDQQRIIERGGIAVAKPLAAEQPRIRIASGTFVMDQQSYTATRVEQTKLEELAVVKVPRAALVPGALPGQSGALVSTETARKLRWPVVQESVLLRDPGGGISRDTEKALDERVGDGAGLYVERGFQRYDQTVMRLMFAIAALLILIVTLISTALSMAEQQADMGTFAAVGATRRTRRALAASQAMVVGFIGAALGVCVGLVPGIAITYPLTTGGTFDPATGREVMSGPFLVIPWQPLLLVVVGVPLLAGLLAAGAIRKAPTMTRRAD